VGWCVLRVLWCAVLWSGVAECVWCGVVWCGVVWCGVVRVLRVLWCGVVCAGACAGAWLCGVRHWRGGVGGDDGLGGSWRGWEMEGGLLSAAEQRETSQGRYPATLLLHRAGLGCAPRQERARPPPPLLPSPHSPSSSPLLRASSIHPLSQTRSDIEQYYATQIDEMPMNVAELI